MSGFCGLVRIVGARALPRLGRLVCARALCRHFGSMVRREDAPRFIRDMPPKGGTLDDVVCEAKGRLAIALEAERKAQDDGLLSKSECLGDALIKLETQLGIQNMELRESITFLSHLLKVPNTANMSLTELADHMRDNSADSQKTNLPKA